MAKKQLKIIRPDAKGRITLGAIAHGVSSYVMTRGKNDCIILEPRVEIPASEQWLFKNKDALKRVKRGLEDSALGNVKSRGSFAKYMDEKDSK